MSQNIYDFWGKTSPYKRLIQHMIDTGCIARVLFEESSLSPIFCTLEKFYSPHPKLINTFICLIAMHDLGKCHHNFQNKAMDLPFVQELLNENLISNISNSRYLHEYGTKKALKRILKEIKMSSNAQNMLSSISCLHHHRDAEENDQILDSLLNPGYWKDKQKEIFDTLCDLFDADFSLLNDCKNCDGAATLLWGITILSDWLASGEEIMQNIDSNLAMDEYFKVSQELSKQAVIDAGLFAGKVLDKDNFCNIWKGFSKDTLRPVQVACENLANSLENKEHFPGLIIIEAPMGEGKTEAALFLTSHLMSCFGKNGFYVALPTAATSNQMVERVSNLLNSHDIKNARLIHSMAWLIEHENKKINESKDDIDNETTEAIASWLVPLRRALLSQYAVGTVDQVMMSILKIRFGILRIIGIASKVIIIDEVHAYDTYMYTIIERLISWCATLKVPVILLSATLPKERKIALIKAYSKQSVKELKTSYPLITTASQDGEIEQIEVNGTYMKSVVDISVEPLLDNFEDLAKLSVLKAGSGGCICVILNTVKEAQNFFKILKEEVKNTDIEVLLFHARFPAEDRQFIENQCLDKFGKKSLFKKHDPEYKDRPKKAILVATQVVEQSLDLDFDLIISAICPIDLLLQRIGRLHRHIRIRPENFKKAKTIILTSKNPIEETLSAFVYEPWILNKTLETIKNIDKFKLPEDIRSLIEEVYNAKPEGTDEQYEQWLKLTMRNLIDSQEARKNIFPIPDEKYFFITQREENFLEEEDIFKSRSTRIGGLSIRIAIVSLDLIKNISIPSKSIAEKIMARSVSISVRSIPEKIKGYDGYENPIIGEGLLKGIWILPSNDKKYIWKYDKKIETIIEDPELGIIIKEEI